MPEALQQLVADPPAILLADIGMPGQDGYSLVETVRASADERIRSIPAVAVTAYASVADRDRARAAGFDVHVSKPVDLPALIAIVGDTVGRQATRR